MGPADHVRDWLQQLAARIAPAMKPAEIAGRINILAPDLASEFPPSTFTHASMLHTARLCFYFPNFAELCAALAPWWEQHRPAPISLPEPVPELPQPHTATECEAVSATVQRIIANLRTDAPEPRAIPASNYLTRAELTEAYKRAGIKGPQLQPPILKAATLRGFDRLDQSLLDSFNRR